MNTTDRKLIKIRQILRNLICFTLLCILTNTTFAIILYNGDNSYNFTAPDTARENAFNSIAKITNANGTGIVGSAVLIKDKYLLTAEHVLYENVTPRRTHVSFDGSTFWAIDLNFLPIKIGTADLVLFKLIQNPGLPEISLYSSSDERFKTGTLIGWGYGRDPDQAEQTNSTRTWNWGDVSTIEKRWGTNKIEILGNSSIGGNTYNYLQTRLDANQGNNEAAFAYYDSGSGLFISNSGSWELAGITTAVSTFNSSKFASSLNSPDLNYFVRISQYSQNILNNIPDKTSYSGWTIDNSLYNSDADTNSDPDNDGLDNQSEFIAGTNPNLSDTDSDGLLDGLEANTYMTNPLDDDTDDDQLSDGLEVITYTTDPLDVDSDDDGLSDNDEVNIYSSNPLNADSDSDGLNDNDEVNVYGTNLNLSDTDSDGLLDGLEANTYMTNPLDDDTDDDQLSDGLEVITYTTDPLDVDSDDDGLSDNDEVNIYSSNPLNADSDSDGLNDNDEINIYQSNPNNEDSSNDGFTDKALADYGLDPNVNHSLLYNSIIQGFTDLRAGATLIEVVENQATITLNLESSNDLESWIETGDTASLQLLTSNETQFYRFKLSN